MRLKGILSVLHVLYWLSSIYIHTQSSHKYYAHFKVKQHQNQK